VCCVASNLYLDVMSIFILIDNSLFVCMLLAFCLKLYHHDHVQEVEVK
jgi:hypothetical protein